MEQLGETTQSVFIGVCVLGGVAVFFLCWLIFLCLAVMGMNKSITLLQSQINDVGGGGGGGTTMAASVMIPGASPTKSKSSDSPGGRDQTERPKLDL
ncbi:unnamed protein product, partial [Mesorhabditis spiculigera]